MSRQALYLLIIILLVVVGFLILSRGQLGVQTQHPIPTSGISPSSVSVSPSTSVSPTIVISPTVSSSQIRSVTPTGTGY